LLLLLKNSIIDQENALAIGLRKKSFLKLLVVHLQLEFAYSSKTIGDSH